MLTPIPPNSFVNELIEISRERSNEIRIQKELERENREKRKKEEYDKMMISITNIYYDKLKELFKTTAQDGKNTVKFTFDRKDFEIREPWIAWPNQIATRWFGEISDPESKYLHGREHFKGISIKAGPLDVGGRPNEWFNAEFSWEVVDRSWSKYTGVHKIWDEGDTGYNISWTATSITPRSGETSPYIIGNYSTEIEAARAYDKECIKLGFKTTFNFPIENYPGIEPEKVESLTPNEELSQENTTTEEMETKRRRTITEPPPHPYR